MKSTQGSKYKYIKVAPQNRNTVYLDELTNATSNKHIFVQNCS